LSPSLVVISEGHVASIYKVEKHPEDGGATSLQNIYQTRWRHISEFSNLHSHCQENLHSHIIELNSSLQSMKLHLKGGTVTGLPKKEDAQNIKDGFCVWTCMTHTLINQSFSVPLTFNINKPFSCQNL
jgi:hypothetical protein